jgi:hypothetical protein
MSYTRFSSDPARIKKQLEETTFTSRYMLDTPGPGMDLNFMEDPQIRMQRFGANLCENTTSLESDLLGLTRRYNRDLVDVNDFKKYAVVAPSMNWGVSKPYTDESRASCPAWMYRTVENNRWEFPILNPQNGLEKNFNENIQTRILEKDNYVPIYPR